MSLGSGYNPVHNNDDNIAKLAPLLETGYAHLNTQ